MERQERIKKAGEDLKKVIENCKAFLSIYNEDSTIDSSRERFREIVNSISLAELNGHGPHCQCDLSMVIKMEMKGDRVNGLILNLKNHELYFLDTELDTKFKMALLLVRAGVLPHPELGYRMIGLEELAARNYRPYTLISLLKTTIEDIIKEVDTMMWEQKVTQPVADA